MRLINDGGFSEDERIAYREIIFSNTVQSMQVIIEAMNGLGIAHHNPDCEAAIQLVLRQPSEMSDRMPADLVDAINILVADDGVQEAIQRSNEFQLNDSAS